MKRKQGSRRGLAPLLDRPADRLHLLDHRHLAVQHGEMRADDVEEALAILRRSPVTAPSVRRSSRSSRTSAAFWSAHLLPCGQLPEAEEGLYEVPFAANNHARKAFESRADGHLRFTVQPLREKCELIRPDLPLQHARRDDRAPPAALRGDAL